MRSRIRRAVVLLTSVSALTLGLTASPAPAATGDWRTFKTLCKAGWCVNNGNLVRLWQAVLWADGNFNSTSEIDGDFGSRTHSATVEWQGDWWVAQDGEFCASRVLPAGCAKNVRSSPTPLCCSRREGRCEGLQWAILHWAGGPGVRWTPRDPDGRLDRHDRCRRVIDVESGRKINFYRTCRLG